MRAASPDILQFVHPEPDRPGTTVWPVFIPFSGCRFRCMYCAQHVQTGQSARRPEQAASEMASGIITRFHRTGQSVSLGFFGGTFTALDREEMLLFLEQARSLKSMGAVSHVRCSTRPDCIDEQVLGLLKYYGMDMIELGVQSFEQSALDTSGRGYSANQAAEVCRMVQKYGFELGIQLLPGLPGSKPSGFVRDIRTTVEISPLIVRIYPCLVIKGTPLAVQMKEGLYRPWSLPGTTALLSQALLSLWLNRIQVVRTGLSPEPGLLKSILGGPWHPALGSICRSAALKAYILFQMGKTGARPSLVFVPKKYISDFWGYKRMNAQGFAKKGVCKGIVKVWDRKYFRIYSC